MSVLAQPNITNPFVSSSLVQVFMGFDYLSSLGNSLDFSCSTWTTMSSATVITLVDQNETTLVTGSMVTYGAGSQTVRVELTAANLAGLGQGRRKCRLKAALGSNNYILSDFILEIK